MGKQILGGKAYLSKLGEEPIERAQLGEIQRIVPPTESPVGVSLVKIGPEVSKHYHRFTTEIYICTGGKGRLILDGEPIELVPGTVVTVKPGAVHQPLNDGNLEVMIVVTPPPGNPPDRVIVE